MSKKGLLWTTLAAILLLVAIAAISVSVWIKGYLRSDDFRALVAARTGDALHLDAAYTPFRWAGSSIFADTLKGTGREHGIIDTIQADQIRAEINWRAALDGAWRVDRIDIVNFEGNFRPGSTGATGGAEGGPQGGPVGGSEGGLRVAQGGSTEPPFSQWLPRRFELGQLNIATARLGFAAPGGGTLATLDNTALRLRPDGSGWAIEGNGGILTLSPYPALNLVSFRSRLQGKTFFLTDSQLQLGNGKITASGEFADTSKLRLEWNNVDIAPFLDAAWKTRLTGIISGTSEVSWPESGIAAGKAVGKAVGTFRLTEGLVQNVQLLEQIATFTGAPQFRRMPLQEFSANYTWEAGNITLSNIVAESKGLLRVEGTCSIAADGAVQGALRVGVTPQTLQWLPGSRERVFTLAQNGYLWTDVRLAGTTQNLQEDLSARLANAMKDQVIQEGTRVLEVLPGPAKEGAKGVLDMLTPLIP